MILADKVKLPFKFGSDGATALDGYKGNCGIFYSEPEPRTRQLDPPLDGIMAKYGPHIKKTLEESGMTLEDLSEKVKITLCKLVDFVMESHNDGTSEGASSDADEDISPDAGELYLEDDLLLPGHQDLDEPGRSAQEDDMQYALYNKKVDSLLKIGEGMLELSDLSGAEDYVDSLMEMVYDAIDHNGRFRDLMKSRTGVFYDILDRMREIHTDEERPNYDRAIEILDLV